MFVGIDVGGTKCAIVTGDAKGNILSKTVFKTERFDITYNKIKDAIKSLNSFVSIGISCGGPLDEENGIILSPPNLPDWEHVEIVKDLGETFSVPVKLRNDANACALAEFYYGAGKGSRNMVFLTFGTGMGAGIIINGKLYSGSNGNAGEIGHIRISNSGPTGYGKKGSFEGFCSGQGIKKLGDIYRDKAIQQNILPLYAEKPDYTVKDIADAARCGDKTALKIFDVCAKKLGQGLSVLVDLLNPDVIVLGSVYPRCIDLLQKSTMKALKKECLENSLSVCKILPCALQENIGDVAALVVAYDALNNYNKGKFL